ncbi:MAG: methyltransferase domain-containing protein [Deltaproteobacteria bacterium]|nr:MAG: methyltransferase domain-containing protein [Deltaproteobacteria bacterium]
MDHELRKRYFEELEKEIKELVDPKTGLLDFRYAKIIPCPLCGAEIKDHETLFLKNGYTFVRCTRCDMIFTNPQVKDDYLKELYGKSCAADLWFEIQESSKEQVWKKNYYLDNINLILKFCPNKVCRLLDIGCSSGYFLQLLENYYKDKIRAVGIELNEKAVSYASNKGLQVRKCLLEDMPKEEKYDIFTLFGLLEHLPSPKHFLQQIKDYANPGALIFAIVPNAYSLYHLFLQQKSVSFDGRNHLLYFSENTIKQLFQGSGHEVIFNDTILTGLDNIKRHIQWYDPYGVSIKTDKYIPWPMQAMLNEDYIYRNNLGLRLRLLAKISC